MPAIEQQIQELEAECIALCHEYQWLNAAGMPNYRLILSHSSTFRPRADLMLLCIHPHGDASLADGPSGKPPRHDPAYTALLDETWGNSEPGALQLQAIARDISRLFGDEPEQTLRHAPAGNMIPFRAESISRLPDSLRKQGLAIGARLVGLVRPRVLVLMGGDRVLFGTAISKLPGRVIDSHEETFGVTRRAYRDAVVVDDETSTFAAVVPLHALEDGLRTLQRRLEVTGAT